MNTPTIGFSTRTILIFMLYSMAIYGIVAGGMYALDKDLAVKAKVMQEASVKW
jgi:hypothetical protein